MGCSTSVNVLTPDRSRKGQKAVHPEPVASFHDEHIVVDRLGKGAFATVYSAFRASDHRDLAVKVSDLREKTGSNKGQICARATRVVEREVKAMTLVGQKEHCVGLVDIYVEGFLSYIVMDLCEQTFVEHIVMIPFLNENAYAGIFKQMLQALACIHELGVVHNDVKLDNFLVHEGVVKLADFGLARSLRPGDKGFTDIYGTAPFMAPEMLLGCRYREEVDVWSFAVTVYVLFYGQFPYQPAERTSKAMKDAIAVGLPAPSFKPKQGLLDEDSCGSLVSPEATNFVKSILRRKTEARSTAAQALEHPWFARPIKKEPSGLPSLRLALSSAERSGAFTRPFQQFKREQDHVDGTDLHMESLQRAAHRAPPTPTRPAKGAGCKPNATRPPSKSDSKTDFSCLGIVPERPGARAFEKTSSTFIRKTSRVGSGSGLTDSSEARSAVYSVAITCSSPTTSLPLDNYPLGY